MTIASEIHAESTTPSDDFPVHWRKPTDAQLFWQYRPDHFPYQIKPLAEQFCIDSFECGYRVHDMYGVPVHLRAMVVNGYYYMAFAPPVLPPGVANGQHPINMAEVEAHYMRNLRPTLARLEVLWRQEWLPEIQAYIVACEAFDLRAAALPDLLAHLTFALERQKRMAELISQIMLPAAVGMLLFSELYAELFPDSDQFAALMLLQGQTNKSMESDLALWELSRCALALPTVKALFATCADDELLAQLALSAEGRQFQVALDAFLFEYGKRSDSHDAFGNPSWLEDPAPLFKNLRDYLAQPERDLPAEHQSFVDDVQKALAATHTRLQSYPQAVRDHFAQALKTAQVALIMKEDHNYWIDQRAAWQMRTILLEFGRRFAEGAVLAQPLDVMYLTLPELQATAAQVPSPDRHALVTARKAEFEHFGKLAPPPILGAIPTMAPPNDIIARALKNTFGRETPHPLPTDTILRGLAASPGKVRGLAKVVLSLAAADKLQKGDILVTQMTMPPWTPLFANVAAVVTETGGILCHSAVSAREYRIPAVLGIGGATQRIEDGMLLEVDGDAGTVQIVE